MLNVSYPEVESDKLTVNNVGHGDAFRIKSVWYLLVDHPNNDNQPGAIVLRHPPLFATFISWEVEIDEICRGVNVDLVNDED